MFEIRSKTKWYFPPGKWFYGPTPLPSGISWASDPPTLLEFPIPAVVGVGYFLEPHIAEFTSQVARPCEGWERKGNKSTLVSLHFSWVTTLDKHWSNMKPIRNVCPACQGSEKRYSVNRSESTLMLVGRKRDEDKTPVLSAIFNRFRLRSKDTSFFWRL